MSDQNQENVTANEKPDPAPKQANNGAAGKQKDPVRRWTLILLIAAAVLLFWHLRSDRVTPITSQAKVHALVVPIAPEVSGTVTDVFVSNNQRVEAGQMLFQVDRERYEFAVRTARAALDQAYQGQGAAGANVDAARANLEATQANRERARLDAERMRRIRDQDPGAISERRIESAVASFALAEGQVEAAKAALDAAVQQLGKPGDENAMVQQAQAGLETALLNLERATVRAPLDGVVTGVQLDKGSFAGAGYAQMTFIATHNVWVQADYKENNLGHIDAGDAVGIVFDVLPGRVFAGTVREVGYGVDVSNPPLGKLPTIQNDKNWLRAAQRYPVLIDFELPMDDNGRTRLKVGSQATVVVYTGTHPMFNFLARLYLRLDAILTYAY
jgi:multidrug resistance efflux pump